MLNKVLTISVAAYNVEKYLIKTLDSLIVPEIMPKIEVIIVNDGSNDKTGQIADSYARRFPDTFIHINKQNGGWGSTINVSSKIARGKYYKLLDGDDWFNKEALTSFIIQLEKTNTDLVFTQYTEVYEVENRQKIVEQNYSYNEVFGVGAINTYSMHALTVRTEIVRNKEFCIQENCFYTDVEYCIKCLLYSHSAVSFPINIYQYRLGREEQSVSIQSLVQKVDEHDKVVRIALETVYNTKKLSNMKENINALAARHFNILLCLRSNENNWKMFQSFRILLKECYPEVKFQLPKYQRILLYCPKWVYNLTTGYKRIRNGAAYLYRVRRTKYLKQQ